MPVTKIIYKTRKILGINVSVPTGEKIRFDKKLIDEKWNGKNYKFLITYRARYQYFLACPKEKIPKDGFIKIGGSKLDMKLIHKLCDEQTDDDLTYVRMDLEPGECKDGWGWYTGSTKDIDYEIGEKHNIIKLLILSCLGYVDLEVEVVERTR